MPLAASSSGKAAAVILATSPIISYAGTATWFKKYSSKFNPKSNILLQNLFFRPKSTQNSKLYFRLGRSTNIELEGHSFLVSVDEDIGAMPGG